MRSGLFAILLTASAIQGQANTKTAEENKVIAEEAGVNKPALTVAAAESALSKAAKIGDTVLHIADTTGFVKGGVITLDYIPGEAVQKETHVIASVDAKAKTITLSKALLKAHAKLATVQQAEARAEPMASSTTTITPWDSSSGSSGTSSDSLVSDSLNADSSLRSYSLGSGTSSGSQNSGSSGSYMNNWLWALLVAALICCIAGGALMGSKKKAAPKKKKAAPKPAPAPAPEPVVEVEPLLPALTPLATTSAVVPSYSMVAPATTAYAAPMAYAAPATTAYAAPATTAYAAPAMTSYAAPAYGGYPGAMF